MRANCGILACAGLALLPSPGVAADTKGAEISTVPVILDTDIGGDIDDTWALVLMLRSPELDLRLITTTSGDTRYRAKIVAKLLEIAGRTDIPIGIGTSFDRNGGAQAPWVEDYDLSAYAGAIHEDGIAALIDEIMRSPETVTVVAIGAAPNLGEALRREPRIAEHAKLVGMYGSVYRGYGGSATPEPEANVRYHTPDCRTAFTAGWDITITPLDTCGLIVLDGELYGRIRDSNDPLLRALIENYRIWAKHVTWIDSIDTEATTSTLFDTVAVHLAMSEEWLVMEDLGIRITDDGMTVVDDTAKHVRVALEWADLDAFKRSLVDRLLAGR